jgi:hypothetical protein
MPYNVGMTELSLVLPFALPPPDLAPDLIKALDAPALGMLLARSSVEEVWLAPSSRALPHDNWLAGRLGLLADEQPAFAVAAMRGFGLDPGSEHWLIVNPAHFAIARSHLSLSDPRQLRLSDAHGRMLFDAAKPYFDELGHTLVFGDAHTWFMHAGHWQSLQTASPDIAIDLNLTDWLPSGHAEVDYRRLQNEVQMLWFSHPANAEREAAGQAAVNAFWIWGCAKAAAPLAGAPALATRKVPGWLGAMQTMPFDLASALGGAQGDAMFVSGDLTAPALAGDWATWLDHLRQFDLEQFAPALAALQDGRLKRLQLVLSHRAVLKTFTTTQWGQRAFWRGPSLTRLLP